MSLYCLKWETGAFYSNIFLQYFDLHAVIIYKIHFID